MASSSHLVAKGDPEAPLRWAAVRRALRQLPAQAVVLAEDECHLDLLPWVRATWILRGQRQLVMTPRAEPAPLPLRGR